MSEWFGHRVVDVDDRLLDRQVTGPDGEPLGKVDDVEFEVREGERPEVVAILVGVPALAGRIGGRWGRLLGRVAGGLRFGSPRRIPLTEVRGVDPTVTVTEEAAAGAADERERWWRDRVVSRIPGAARKEPDRASG